MLDKEELKSQVAVSSVAEEAEVKTVLAAPEIQPMPAKEDVAAPEIQPMPAKEEPMNSGYRSEMDGVEVDFELQYRDRETDMQSIATRVTEDYVRRGNAADKIELIHVYLKPTDFTAYYVINNVYEGKIPLF